jgi:hypothetical protein
VTVSHHEGTVPVTRAFPRKSAPSPGSRPTTGRGPAPELMVVSHKVVELTKRAETHLMDLPGVAPQHATHLHALTCAGLHERLNGLRGKVHVGARGGPDGG